MSTNQRIRGRRLQTIRKRHMQANPLCVMCAKEGRVEVGTELDHIVAMANGGPDVDSNRQLICAEHHRAKTAEDMGTSYRPKVTIGLSGWPE